MKESSKMPKPRIKIRYGIGEWYGRSFVRLTPGDRQELARLQNLPKTKKPEFVCPFRSTPESRVLCTKPGGVCSLRYYQLDEQTGRITWPAGKGTHLVTICPHRFKQGGLIYKWIGEDVLGCSDPLIVGEVGFLEQVGAADHHKTGAAYTEDVGRIDNVLVHSSMEPLQWVPLEIQAVYFSGPSMSKEFGSLRASRKNAVPFPAAIRRPDYRSSGPKRLMPQLQIKVPTLRRWGKKMAVVVDLSFFDALGSMDDVRDISNCDIAWFVVDYDEGGGEFMLRREFVRMTTLERAVEGLTGGNPVSLTVFERRIGEKLAGKYPDFEASPGPGR
jgi:hypothetical protein